VGGQCGVRLTRAAPYQRLVGQEGEGLALAMPRLPTRHGLLSWGLMAQTQHRTSPLEGAMTTLLLRGGAAVGEPIPGTHAHDGHAEPLVVRGESLEKGGWSGLHMAVLQHCAVVVHETDSHAPGLQVDTASTRGVDWCRIACEVSS
jgi:hypothetical protein